MFNIRLRSCWMALFAVLNLNMCVLIASICLANEWSGKYEDGKVLTRGDIEQFIKNQKEFQECYDDNIKSGQVSSECIAKPSLDGTLLEFVDFEGAHLKGAIFARAKLMHAQLRNADLRGAQLQNANLSGAQLQGADLEGADLWGANLSNADLSNANLNRANLNRADLSGALLFSVSLERTNFAFSNLLIMNSFLDLHFNNTDLTNAVLYNEYTYATDGGGMRYRALDEHGLSRDVIVPLNEASYVRRYCFENGYREVERQATYIIEREKVRNKNWFEKWLYTLLFEWPAGFGLYYLRPLILLGLIIIVCMFIYIIPICGVKSNDGIYQVWSTERLRQDIGCDTSIKLTRYGYLALCWAFYFSLLSSFHIGWRELNLGSFFVRMQRREYILKATGWVRTVAGVQSVLSVYLLALWVLCTFGRPFG